MDLRGSPPSAEHVTRDDDREAAGGRETPFLDPLADFLLDKSTGTGSGTYRRNLERDVRRFAAWYERDRGERPTLGTLDDGDFRAFARALRRGDVPSMESDAPARGTVRTYYANVSAYVAWLLEEDLLEEHVAQTDRATAPLPEDDGRRSGDQQAWSTEQRRQLLAHVDERARAVLDDAPGDGIDRWELLQARRDRALVYVLAFTGVRGAEILSHPGDDRRNGARWRDVSLDDRHLTVRSKKRTETWSDRSLPPQAVEPLELLRSVLDPPTGEWPLFPSMHRPTLYGRLRDAMADAGVDDVDARLREADAFALLREYGCVPPSLTTNGARAAMKRLTEAAGIEVGPHAEYLQLHGARRGAGEILVREKGYAAAARLLDNTERMVRERYSHIEAGEFAEAVGDAFASQDGADDG